MTVNYLVFGELVYNYGWSKTIAINFFGKELEIDLMIDGELKIAAYLMDKCWGQSPSKYRVTERFKHFSVSRFF